MEYLKYLAWWHPFALVLIVWTSLVVFYVLYVFSINIWESRKEISNFTLGAVAPVLLLMIMTDFVMQMTLFSLFFMDIPRNLLVTARLKRYRAQPSGWRKRFADALCTRGLNTMAPTKFHC